MERKGQQGKETNVARARRESSDHARAAGLGALPNKVLLILTWASCVALWAEYAGRIRGIWDWFGTAHSQIFFVCGFRTESCPGLFMLRPFDFAIDRPG